jgi:hypothetical protein
MARAAATSARRIPFLLRIVIFYSSIVINLLSAILRGHCTLVGDFHQSECAFYGLPVTALCPYLTRTKWPELPLARDRASH